MIAPGYSKAFQLLAIATFQSTIGMIKRKNYLISYNLMGAIDRAGIRQFSPYVLARAIKASRCPTVCLSLG